LPRPAAQRLAERLGEHGNLNELCARADARDVYATWRLAKLLAERADLDGLRGRANAGDWDAAGRHLAELLIRQGRSEEAKRLGLFGLNPDGSIASA